MRRISIEIMEATFEDIAEDAARERRTPREHAGWLLDQWARRMKVGDPIDWPDRPVRFAKEEVGT